jgi:hypothetical protein
LSLILQLFSYHAEKIGNRIQNIIQTSFYDFEVFHPLITILTQGCELLPWGVAKEQKQN